MNISYQTKKLEKQLTTKGKLVAAYGLQAATKINQRLQELDAAMNLSEVPPAARTHPHAPKHKGIFSVDILKHQHPLRLIFRAEGTFDLSDYSTIEAICILDVTKIHS